jgi:hypothetical protein
MKKSVRSKKSTPRSKKATRFAGSVGQQAAVLTVIGVVAAAAMLFAARRSSPLSDVSAADFQQEKAASHARAKSASEPIPANASLDTTLAADTTAANPPAGDPAQAPGQKTAPVTITGCLEYANQTYRLKDTSGVDAAKSRSWKSGFFKKSSASIEIVDGTNRLQLPTHVGQRVSVTGLLVDREMQGRTLKRVAAGCNIEPVQGSGLKTVAQRF